MRGGSERPHGESVARYGVRGERWRVACGRWQDKRSRRDARCSGCPGAEAAERAGRGRGGSERSAILLDFATAFPSLVHRLIFAVLCHMRVPQAVVNLIATVCHRMVTRGYLRRPGREHHPDGRYPAGVPLERYTLCVCS